MKTLIIDSAERFRKIRKAVEERDCFLEKHPNLEPFQEEIERRLKHAVSMRNRITILSSMIEEKLLELREASMEARRIWERIC
ncbi:MAG: hypothetical protein SVY10_20100 [Thermodesulfobacteriota bacterium]|nr:hypothetical protein [Thermodesulfobacteriota bacterium]